MDIFCKIVNGEIPTKKIYEDDIVMVIMDVNPRSNGHCLVIPKNHYQDLYDIEDNTLSHILLISRKICALLKERLQCDGITLEQNNGECQEVKHYHMHIIPRYKKAENIEIDEIYKRIIEE